MRTVWAGLVAILMVFLVHLSGGGKGGTSTTTRFKKKIYSTRKVSGKSPVIDGRLDDPAWGTVNWGGDFIQREPYEGKAPSQETAFKILYDDKNLYVGIRAYDSEPGKIDRRLSRRDRFEGDWVEINIDSLFDKRTAFSFTLSAAGVKGDEYISNNGGSWDPDWNPVWYAGTNVDEEGWTAEMKIPFSQLRFPKKQKHVWGLQVNRRFFREEERDNWQFIPRDAPGWVHLFGELHGIEGIKGKREIEMLPYLVGRYETFERVEGNPFDGGDSSSFDGGLDGKVGLSSDLTLDFTINPDFGQVEADPSEVNLTTYETFFDEKRPFFIEGNNILNLRLTGGDGSFASDNLFYSRRVGGPPHLIPVTGQGEFLDYPESTRILAAFKLTGKTRKGLSLAVMESITSRESAVIDFLGQRRLERVEPFTNYLALRLQQDYRNGDTRIGGMFTSTHRDIDSENLDFLHRSALTGGLDFYHTWKDKTYFVDVKLIFSRVTGSKAAILETQLSPLRYFQRPDANHVTLDPERTSLGGHGGTLALGKTGRGHIQYSAGVTWRSPGLELNDIGYLRAADRAMQWAWLGYRIWKPFAIFREIGIDVNQYQGWDFGGTRIFNGGNVGGFAIFKNFWALSTGIERSFRGIDNNELRGGPSLLIPGEWTYWYQLISDHRKKVRLHITGGNTWGDEQSSTQANVSPGITWQPMDSLSLSLAPVFSWNKKRLQYVTTKEFQDEYRYIFARIEQTTAALTFRFDLSLSPELSIQFYGQPFVSAGRYSELKRITEPRSPDFSGRFHTFSGGEIVYDPATGEYRLDENLDGETDYRVAQPDFSFRQFRSNLVLRWEFKPGSILYLVWSQGRTGTEAGGAFSLFQDFGDLFRVPPHDVFLIKFTYLFNL